MLMAEHERSKLVTARTEILMFCKIGLNWLSHGA